MRLGIKLIGIANDLLFDGFRPEVSMRKGQVLMLYLACSETCSCVPFCHSSMLRKAFATQNLCSKNAVTYVRLCAETMDGRCIHPNIPDIMQHGGFPKKLFVCTQFGMLLCYLKCSPSHISTMSKKQLLQRLVAFAILMN